MKTILASIAMLLIAFAAHAEGQITHTITMRAGYVGSYTSPVPFTSALIGKPEVIDAVPQSDRTLMLTAKSAGTTNMLILDERGNEIANIGVQVIGRDVNRVQIHSMLGNLQGYTAYECGPTYCARSDDKLAGSDRVPVYPPMLMPNGQIGFGPPTRRHVDQ
jgi:putative type II/III system pilus formation protein